MTAVLTASLGAMIGIGVSGGTPSPQALVCPGARHGAVVDAASVTPAVTAPTGALPPQLQGQPVRMRLLPFFERWAAACDVPPSLVEATCWWESGWQTGVVSDTGALGVCQIEPATAQTVRGLLDDQRLDPRSASDNIEMSAAYLRWLLDNTGGRRDLALAGYYQGLTSVQEHGILASSRPYVAGITALLHEYSW
jgi:soluble lytic murein transglycosylase-like protein